MERRKIHPEGPEFSQLITGAWRWESLSGQAIEKLINTSYEVGITTFDHADIYGNYSCEELFGNALKDKSSFRTKIQLVTKCGIKLISAKWPETKVKHYDTSKEHIIKSAENSLKNLHTDYLDLLLIHRPDPLMNPEEISSAFNYLKHSGKVLHFGVSNFTTTQFEMLSEYVDEPLVTNQVEVSLFKPELLTDGTIDLLVKHKISPMAWSPMGGGEFFTNQYQFSELRNQLNKLADKYTCKTSQLILAWLFKHPSKMLPILGTSNPQRIEESVKALSIQLERQDWFAMLKASTGKDIA